MPLINRQPFKPNPIPDDLGPDDGVFYYDLTNEIFTSHDAFLDRFLYCNSLIWTCSKTGKSGLTYKEALDSEQSQGTVKKKKGKRPAPSSDETTLEPTPTTPKNKSTSEATINGDGVEQPVKKKKKKYPYDPKKYSMPVPEGFDPSLLTPTGKIDGRKLKSKKNKQLAEELLSSSLVEKSSSPGKKGKKHKEDEAKKKEDEAKKKEEETKKKAQLQAELAKERELEAKRKKEAAALARQLERQKKDEERKRAAAFLANWEKKCEDLERDDLKRLPQPTPVNCDIPEKLFGDSIFIMEAVYNFHDLYNFSEIYPDGMMSFDTLEEILMDKQEEGAFGTLLQFLLKVIFYTQPTKDGYGLDDDSTIQQQQQHQQENANVKQENNKTTCIKTENDADGDLDYDANGTMDSEADDDENEDNEDKYVNMNDLIGSAIKAAQEVKKSFSKPLPEMEITPSNVTEILRLHLLQSGSFPKGRTIYNGWYSSREDPGLWLCMQEPDLIKKLGEVTIYDLDIEERIKILHTLIYQLLTFIKSRTFMEMASEQLTELRKAYRKEAADFARWDRENCVKRMQPPKRKNDQTAATTGSDKTNNPHHSDQDNIKSEFNHQNGNNNSIGDEGDGDTMTHHGNKESNNNNDNNQQLKSCLKANGMGLDVNIDNEETTGQTKKKISFKSGLNGAMDENGSHADDCGESNEEAHNSNNNEDEKNPASNDETEQSYEELERAYQQNTVDYEDYQRERAIRLEQLNQTLLDIRINLRNNQSVYAIHPIGRDRAYRRYWLFQSLPGLFVEQEDEYVGKCLPQPTPLESRYKKLFGKENPLMHPNEADLIRTKTCDVACSTESVDTVTTTTSIKKEPREQQQQQQTKQENEQQEENEQARNTYLDKDGNQISDRLNGDAHDGDHDGEHANETEQSLITDEMNYCTGDENTCFIHGKKRPTQPKWWFYHHPESIDRLIDSLNKRGFRESELHDVLSAESSIIKPRVAECAAYKLNKLILEQSGIRRSRRLRTKGSKRRGRNYD